eukprot:6052410-Amphidinium_carterae.1
MDLPEVLLLQLWVPHNMLWLQGMPTTSWSTLASTRGEEGSSFHGNQTMGAAGAPARFRKGPRGQSLVAAGRKPQEDQECCGREGIAPAGPEGAQIKGLTSAVDKQQELLSTATTKLQELRKELATAHVDLARLPEDVLPVPKKILEYRRCCTGSKETAWQAALSQACAGGSRSAN